ncbi:MAG: hypothetical protein GF308_02545 [Candidatus Heimdallarchaeota archaeon]|nr:hypothetical protein [Candidatus Heimdallarchaeota archaeon]
MKCAFVYFSGTGITPKFASEIAKGMKSRDNATFDFLRVKKGEIFEFTNYDFIGIGAPAYSLRAPRLMTKLLRKMTFHGKPFFVFATYNTMPGNTLWDLYRVVKKSAGVCLGYLQGSITVNIRAWNPKKSSGKQLKKITEAVKDQARAFGKKLVGRYQQWLLNKDGQQQQAKWVPPKRLLLVTWAAFFTWNWQMMLTVGFKRVDKKKCTRCGLCATKICPSEAIYLTNEHLPTFVERRCVGCNGCVNLCPEDAIWTYQTRNRLPYDLYKEYILNEEQIKIEEEPQEKG